ncbi:MAG TPA: hypothetical protein VFA70_02205 [Dehalococcoidia bacterium]|nr:hypothetical protein [Dehalococcoidia bacterium]
MENQSGNLLAEFDTEGAAPGFVRESILSGARASVLSWSMHRSDRAEPAAYGQTLAGVAKRRAPV